MVKPNSTFETPSVIGGADNVDFLKKRWLTIVDLYELKVLPENGDIGAFVQEMRDVEGRAREMWVKLRWTHEDDGSMAYVTPKEASNTIFFNLRTLAFDSQHRGTLAHEFTHLKQQWVTGNAYTVPGIDKLSTATRQTLYKKSGMTNLAIRDVLEGLVEWSTAVRYGKNKNVAYTYFQVPEVQKLNKYVLEKTGISIIACYVQMTPESMKRCEQALTEAAYQTMLEESATSMVKRWLSTTENRHIQYIAQKLVTDATRIESLEDAAEFVLHTRVPATTSLQFGISERIQSAVGEDKIGEYDIVSKEAEDAEMGVNIFWEIIYPVADKVVWILSNDGRTQEIRGVALSS